LLRRWHASLLRLRANVQGNVTSVDAALYAYKSYWITLSIKKPHQNTLHSLHTKPNLGSNIDLVLIDQQSVGKRSLHLMDTVTEKEMDDHLGNFPRQSYFRHSSPRLFRSINNNTRQSLKIKRLNKYLEWIWLLMGLIFILLCKINVEVNDGSSNDIENHSLSACQ
jgi:hypothetical protein